MPRLHYLPACEDDFEALLALRIAAMRPSLEALGRYDPERARARFRQSFVPACTHHILLDNRTIGFYAVKPEGDGLLLDHLYLHPAQQGRSLGSEVLQRIFAEADRLGLPLRVGALRGSTANHFYQRHGFVQVDEAEWDIYYRRLPTRH